MPIQQKENLPYNNRILFYGECIDSNDPLNLGRIRAILKSENVSDREKSVNEALGVTEKWSDKDPFVVRPLLPFFVNVSPKVNEYVHLFYSRTDDLSNKDKFYIGGIFSSLTNVNNEPYESATGISNLGSRNKKSKELINLETGEVYDPKTNGVYSKPEDVSLDGRGSADLVLKDDTVLLRAGKFRLPPTPNVYPIANTSRAFLQLSKYNMKTTYGAPEVFYKANFEHKNINLLLEYNVITIDSTVDSHTGNIYLYTLKPSDKTNTKNFTISSDVDEDKSLYEQFSFIGLTISRIREIINQILNGLVNGEIPQIKDITPTGPFAINTNISYPFYYRPQLSLYNKRNSTTSTTAERLNVVNLMSGIGIGQSNTKTGYGLIYDETKKESVPFKPQKEVIIPKKEESISNTASLLGADYVYLLSHKSVKKDTGKINLDDTIYGIEEQIVADEIEPKTSSTVRGEELLELLNLMVQFMIGHVHPYHGMAPDSVSLNGVSIDKLTEELRNALDKVLNKYIRIN